MPGTVGSGVRTPWWGLALALVAIALFFSLFGCYVVAAYSGPWT